MDVAQFADAVTKEAGGDGLGDGGHDGVEAAGVLLDYARQKEARLLCQVSIQTRLAPARVATVCWCTLTQLHSPLVRRNRRCHFVYYSHTHYCVIIFGPMAFMLLRKLFRGLIS